MPRGPRYLPPGWSVEVSTRTICGFYLLPANPQFARIMVGILGRAQEKYPVLVHAAVAASNHYHLILTPADLEQLADFCSVSCPLAEPVSPSMAWFERRLRRQI